MGSGVDLDAYRELVKDKGGMRHGTRFFYSNLNLSRMCMWEEVERNNREEDMKQALHERIALNKSLGQYWDNLRNENKRALVKSCLNAEDLQNFTRENTPVIEFLTKINPEVIWEYTFLAFELTYFQSGARFLEIAQSDTLNLKSEKFFSLLDGASESTWLLGGSPKVEHVLDHCMEVLKNAGDGDVIASSCLRIEQKLLEGYIQAEVDKDKTRNRRAQKKERYAGPKNPRVQDISGLLNTNTVDNSTKGDAKIQDVVVNSDVGNLEVEAKVVGEARSTQIDELGSQTLDIVTGMARDYCATSSESLISEEARQGDGASMFEPLAQPDSGEEDEDQSAKDVSGSATARTTSQLQSSNAKSKKQEASGPSSPSPGVFSSVVSSNEPGGSSSNPSGEAAVPQTMAMEIRAMQDMMKKLMDMHEKLQEQMAVMKAIEADNVAMWVQRLEEFPKQVTGLIDDFVNKDFGVMLEKKVKNELADIKDAFVCANTPGIEQTQTVPWLYLITVRVKCEIKQLINWRIWSNQNLKLLSHSFELWLNKFLRKCRATLDLLEAEYLKRIGSAPRKYPVHTKLVKELNLALSSAIGLSRNLHRDLIAEQRNLVSEAVKVKLSRLVSECKYDEAFSCALERDKTDIGLVPWLCSQVDLRDILVVQVHIPLSITSILKLQVRLAEYYEINQEACVQGWMVCLEIAMDRIQQMASIITSYRINQGRHDLQC